MRAPDGIVRVIADIGVGIPEVSMKKVFDAFFTTRHTVGTGIGLFVAKQFVEGHGGSISIESSTHAKDHGTRVRLFLPLVTAYAASDSEK